jgi:2-polyprenyl-3-methyl-5-hydroxy-6-metoxy-1,4-benzoquinol methylase
MICWNKNTNKHELDEKSLKYRKVFDNLDFLLLLREHEGLTKVCRTIRNNLLKNAALLTSGDVKKLYDSAYVCMLGLREPKRKVNGFPINEYSVFAFDYLNRINNKQTKIVVDYGSGSGEFCLSLASMGFKVIGLDINPSVISHCNRLAFEKHLDHNLHFYQVDSNANNFIKNCDYVVLTDVVEHLSIGELKFIFEVFRQKLNKNGRIVISTPNGYLNPICNKRLILADILYYIKLIKSCFYSEYDQINTLINAYHEQTHINVMIPPDISFLLKQAGFSNITITYLNDVPFNLNKLGLSGCVGVIAGI